MTSKPTVIHASRLDLIPLEPEVLRLSLAGAATAVEQLLGLTVPVAWYEEQTLIRIRLRQLIADPTYQPWSVRAIALRETRHMVGHIGFHTKPGATYLQPYAPAGVEFGYTIFPSFRRRGYAREACRALMQWAFEQYQVSHFILSIAPDNEPSRRLAQQLGFTQVGAHMDDEDGPEDVFRLDYRGSDTAVA